jgi:hypothetical protein
MFDWLVYYKRMAGLLDVAKENAPIRLEKTLIRIITSGRNLSK